MINSVLLIALSVALSKYLDYFWEFIFIFTDFVLKTRKRTIYGNDLDEFIKHIKYASTWDNDKPNGWIYGCHSVASTKINYYFIGFIVQDSENSSKYLSVICTNSLYHLLTKNVVKNIYIYSRTGSFWNLRYVKELYVMIKKNLYPSQEIVINKILDIYKEKEYCSCLLYGEPNTGKTRTAYYLADCLLKSTNTNTSTNTNIIKSVSIVTDWNPTDPNDSFINMKYYTTPSKECPLIMVLDESDIIVTKIHNNEIKLPHAPMPIEFKNKSDWNKFFDSFDYGIRKHVIIILTSNKSIEYFDEMDSSFIREGRILVKHEFKKLNEN